MTRRRKVSLAVALSLAALIAYSYVTMIRMPGKSFAGPLPAASDRERDLAEALRRDVEMLAKEIGERNVATPSGLARAADFLDRELSDAGYSVARQAFDVRGVACSNLDVELAGSTRRDEIVLVGAHYDSVLGTAGANDNGTGAAAVLALARAFAKKKTPRTLRFVEFVNEEPPHFQTESMGSLVYAKRSRTRGEKIVAMLSVETIGYYSDAPDSQKYPPPLGLAYPSVGNFIGFVGNYGSRNLVRDLVGAFRETTEFPSEGAALPSFIPGVGWSDHWSFFESGYPAAMVTDTAPFRYPHYHTREDTPDKVNYDRMARVVAGLERAIERLASR